VSLLGLPKGVWQALDLFTRRHEQQTESLEHIAQALECIADELERQQEER
jgi:hypothetical protein